MGVSHIIPSLLFGRSITDRQPSIVDYDPVGCGKCAQIEYPMKRPAWRAVLSVDLDYMIVRRYTIYDTNVEPNGGFGDIISYEASLDLPDETALIREIDTQPW